MTEIRILLYADYEEIKENPDLRSWGITELQKLVVYKTKGIGEFRVDFINRTLQRQMLTQELLKQYQELWVLGFNTDRTPPFGLDAFEIGALSAWMDNGGGLFMAGDHAAGFCDIGNLQTFSTHGRSLGEPMKRAGKLRVWEGPPTACIDAALNDRDNFNTCEGPDPSKLDLIDFQSDDTAQTLVELHGPLHRLFWWREDDQGNMIPITKFPDHPHEGKLIIPDSLDDHDEWPVGSPLPVVAAKARDKRFNNPPREYNLVIAYDGDPAGVGRVVVGSSFHHYLNVNIGRLPKRNAAGFPEPESDLDQVAQYYGNLALWLTPQVLRDQIKRDIIFRLATHPDVFEVRGGSIETLSQAAQYALKLELGASNFHRVFAASEFEMPHRERDKLMAAVFLGSDSSANLSASEQATALGAIVKAHHNFIARSGAPTPYWLKEKPLLRDMIIEGMEIAKQAQPSLTEKLLPQFKLALDEF